MNERTVRVAIVGGGCAGMAAAFELTRPEHEGKYRVTVYQLGWRLGGKGASGRGPAGRIEEHGLHVWLGYYENAFRMVRECYAELGRLPGSCPIVDWQDAFFPANYVAAADQTSSGQWVPWTARFPAQPGSPGDPEESYRPPSVTDYLTRAASLVTALFETLRVERNADDARAAPSSDDSSQNPSAVPRRIEQVLSLGTLAGFGALLEALRLMELALGALPLYRENILLHLLDVITRAAQRELESYVRDRDELRRLWPIADLLLATIRGSIRFGLAVDPRGFDAIDDYDCREWLRLNGASEASINSPFVRALYDLGFAYEAGDLSRPRIAAGAAIRGSLRAFFTYKGAFFWKMRAGMGDVVFAPLYEVLKRRGVGFEFFHRLRNVHLSEDRSGPFVSALDFDVQARLLRCKEYAPLVNVGGLPCWPSEPDYAQLRDGERLRSEDWRFESHWENRKAMKKTLTVGEDFDFVVLAVGLGAIRHVCPEIIERDTEWRAMVEQLSAVPTRALQLWFRCSMPELGWSAGPVSLSGFLEPFDTWADMTHLGALEAWPEKPGAIAYLCSVMPDAGPSSERVDPAGAAASVRAAAIECLEQKIGYLWPGAVSESGGFRWDLLMSASGAAKTGHPIDGQFWAANVNPSDQYTLSLPGTTRFRISPLDRTYDNLTLAGDWTACGLNLGCVEAAVMSGMLAAHALSGAPALEKIIGFDHP